MSENNPISKNVKNINQYGGVSLKGITQEAAYGGQYLYNKIPRPMQGISLKLNRTFRVRILQYYKKIIKKYDKFIDNLIKIIDNLIDNKNELKEPLDKFKKSIEKYEKDIKNLLDISKKSKNNDKLKKPKENNSEIIKEIINTINTNINIDNNNDNNNDTNIIEIINNIKLNLNNFKTNLKQPNNNDNNNNLIKKIEILEKIFNIIKNEDLFGDNEKNPPSDASPHFFHELIKFNNEIMKFYQKPGNVEEKKFEILKPNTESMNNINEIYKLSIEKNFEILKPNTESMNEINEIYNLSIEIQSKLNKLNLIFEKEKENFKTSEIIDKVNMKKLTSFVGNNVNSLLVSIIVTLLLFEFFFRNTYNLMSTIKAYFRSMPKSTNNDNNEWLDNNYYRNKNINNQVLYSLNRLSYNRERKFKDINNIKSNNSINPVIYSSMDNNVLTKKDDTYTYGSGGNFIDFLFSVFSPSN
jgi:hypothetical protein